MSSLVSEQPSPDVTSGELLSDLSDPGDAGWLMLTELQELCTLDVCVEAPTLRLQPLELSAAMLRDGFTIADGRY